MVDIEGKFSPPHRTAVTDARVLVNREIFSLIRSGGMKKGDVLTVAQIAGIMGTKRTPQPDPHVPLGPNQWHRPVLDSRRDALLLGYLGYCLL